MVELGPFGLDSPIGKGGMGQVWSGRHLRLQYPVAVKFLTAKAHHKPAWREAFRAEARSIAALDHPNIVRVFDYGEADARTEAGTDGAVPAGTPWLAMERVDGGTLSGWCGRLPWSSVETVIVALLDALGHAHARSVIHRDLKPSNVLVTGPRSMPRIKLNDFGLAQEADGGRNPIGGGTPAYMAPEQFGGGWRDIGPWTDLYAAGCLFWALIHGAPPFKVERSTDGQRRVHVPVADPASVSGPAADPSAIPRLDAPYAVPERLDAWLGRLLAKDPADRFRRAADAVWALRNLGPLVEPAPGAGPPAPLVADHPPIPEDWRAPEGDEPVADAPLAGLGLFAFRTIPLVGRVDERTALWDALRRTVSTRLVHAVVLGGPPGTGKSRLAEWLVQRAHEVGVAQTFRAVHGPIPGPGHGLGPMLRTALRCNGLDRDGVAARVEAMLRSRGVDHPDEWAALTEVIAPRAASWTKAPGGPAGLRFGSPTERYVTVRRLFQALVLERPIVVWLDDVQHGLDALRFALYLLDYPARHPLPVLIVLTVTDDGLAPRTRRLGDESTLLAELVEHDRVERVDVGPLPVEDRPTLIRSLLGLAPALSVRIDDRTAGNPQFAVQLVADWVQRGVITSGPDGYTLRLDEDLPADLHAMWATRIERALAARSDAEVRALELAAVLGTGVDPAEWKAACAEAGDADPSPAVVELLVEHQLATCGPAGPGGGWRFAHPAVRDALEARARRAGRLAALHALCADVLADETHVPGDDHLPERVGRHRLYGDDPEGALSTLFDAAHARLRAGDLAIADELLDLRDTALERSSVPNADVRWGDGWLVRHEIATRQGRWEDADRWLDQIDGAATLFGWDAVRRRVRCLRARRDRVQGRYAKAVAASIDVEQEAAKRGDRALMADARLEIAQALLGSGDVPGAERWGRLALQEYEAQSDKLGTAEAWRVLGETAKEAGDPAEALALLRQAEAAFAERGQRYKVAIAVNGQGDVARAMGDLDQAASLYRRARGLLKAIGSRAWVFPAYNAGLIHLARGDHRRARETLEVAMAEFTRQGNSGALANANLALVLCAAFDEQWLLFDDHLAEADGLLRQTGFCDEDTARLATQAGTASERLQQGPRAVAAYELGQRLWTTLGREAELDAVSRALARVRPG